MNEDTDNVFLKRAKAPKASGLSVALLMNKRHVSGQIGMEIEVEGWNFPKNNGWIIETNSTGKSLSSPVRVDIPPLWRYTKDHSLRGDDNAEYVLAEPIMFDEVSDALRDLWQMFAKSHSRIDESNRTSVHVHVNVQDWHINRLTSFMTMYYVLEDILTQWCGEHRVGNLFCLSIKDAPGIIEQVVNFINSDGKIHPDDNLHYAGLSFYAVKKFGSLEFRTLRGVRDPRVIEDWVKIIRRLYDYSANFPDPRNLVEMFSEMGPLEWFENMLGDTIQIVRNGLPQLTDDTIRDSMYENIRIAQELCYCRDWDLFDPLNIKADPFGRSANYVVEQLNALEEDEEEGEAEEVYPDYEEYMETYDDDEDFQGFEETTQSPPGPPPPNGIFSGNPFTTTTPTDNSW